MSFGRGRRVCGVQGRRSKITGTFAHVRCRRGGQRGSAVRSCHPLSCFISSEKCVLTQWDNVTFSSGISHEAERSWEGTHRFAEHEVSTERRGRGYAGHAVQERAHYGSYVQHLRCTYVSPYSSLERRDLSATRDYAARGGTVFGAPTRLFCALDRTRTCNLGIRRPLLYPLSYEGWLPSCYIAIRRSFISPRRTPPHLWWKSASPHARYSHPRPLFASPLTTSHTITFSLENQGKDHECTTLFTHTCARPVL